MREEGFDHGEAGVRQFASVYGVLEKVTTIEAVDNACSKAKVTTTVKRRPGASPLLFGGFLMNLAAFVSLEDISDALPPYVEEVISVEMDPNLHKPHRKAAFGSFDIQTRYSKLSRELPVPVRQKHSPALIAYDIGR